jgi:hypothetical protein
MRKKLWLGSALLVTIFAAVFAYLAWPRAIPGPPPLPSPNGYDDLVAAGAMVVGQPPDVRTASLDQLRQFVAANHAVVDRLRIGLGRECGVPIEHSQAQIAVALERLNTIRAAGRVLSAEAKVAEKEGRIVDAVKSCLDLVRLGQELARGGLVVDRQMGNAFERDGIAALRAMQSKLTGELRREVMSGLVQIDERAEPIRSVLDREHDFQEALIAEMGIAGFLNRNTLRQQARSAEPRVTAAATAVRQATRLLLIELAIEWHAEENGKPPSGLEDLVPRYLAAVPNDPVADGPFEYTRGSDGQRSEVKGRRPEGT